MSIHKDEDYLLESKEMNPEQIKNAKKIVDKFEDDKDFKIMNILGFKSFLELFGKPKNDQYNVRLKKK